MGRTKIEINTSVFGQRIKLIYVTVGSRTSSASVVQKALEKCGLSDTPLRYQLCVISRVSGQQRLLKDDERPAEVHESSEQNSYFQIRLRQSSILRVHYRTNGDYQTFYSIIVTPSMTTRDVVQVAAARFAPDENPDSFELVKRGQGGVEVLSASDNPFLCQDSCQLELRRIEGKSQTAVSNARLTPSASDGRHTPVVTNGLPRAHNNRPTPAPPMSPQGVRSTLGPHWISQGPAQEAYSQLPQRSLSPTPSQSTPGSNSYSPASECDGLTAHRDGEETSIVERDHGGATPVDSRPNSVSFKAELTSTAGLHNSKYNSSDSSLWVKLEAERVRVIQLEEQLSRWKDQADHLEAMLAATQSTVASKEQEVQSLKEEVDLLKNHQNTILSSKLPTVGSTATQTVLGEGLETEALRRAANRTGTSPMVPSLYRRLQGKTVLAVQFPTSGAFNDLGLEIDVLPSSEVAVKAVREGSRAQNVVLVGDIILEVNGAICSEDLQSGAIELLRTSQATEIILAREHASSSSSFYHSTPVHTQSEDQGVPSLERECVDKLEGETEVGNLGSELCKVQERCSLLQEEMQAINTQLVHTTMDYELVTNEHCELLNELFYHTEEVEEVESLLSEVKVALIKVQEVFGQEDERVSYLEQQNDFLSSELKVVRESQDVLQNQKEALEMHIDVHTKKIEQLETELALVKAENDQLLLDWKHDQMEAQRKEESAQLKLAIQQEENEKLVLRMQQQEGVVSESKAVYSGLQKVHN